MGGHCLIEEMLPDQILDLFFECLPISHRFIAPVNRRFSQQYKQYATRKGKLNKTFIYGVCALRQIEVFLDEREGGEMEIEGNDGWDLLEINMNDQKMASYVAARAGAIDVVEWTGWHDNYRCAFTAHGGHLRQLQKLRDDGFGWNWETCASAASGGHLEVLKWARAQGCEWDVETCACAAESGNLDILKWARSQGCGWDEWTCHFAARGGHLEVLKWARSQGCEWDVETCAYAAENGHIDVLKWARAQGCDWNEDTCTQAVKNGHIEVLKWARAQGCDWNWSVYAYAKEYGHQEILKWAEENGCPHLESFKPRTILVQ